MKVQAPAGTFDTKSTFDLQPRLDALPGGRTPEAQSDLKIAFDNGAAKAEREFHRDTFLTNPLLANRSAPPHLVVAVTIDVTEKHGPFWQLSATVRIVDKGGAMLEEATIGASANEHGAESEGLAFGELGYRVGVYMVCRTGDHPERCAANR